MSARRFGAALGELIHQKRKALGLTQMQLAEDALGSAGKTRRISELESGLVANPHPKTIDPIISILGISREELEVCAKQTGYEPDKDLDRAYREARNLIDAVARQFEHNNPDASLAELDEFLRAKAKEWSGLRERIQEIDLSDKNLSNLKSAAVKALAAGHFDKVDLLLSDAERVQEDKTLNEVRKHAEIKVARGDNNLLRGNSEVGAKFYLDAANLFVPFDENETVSLLEEIASRVYYGSQLSLEPSYLVAVSLLERALSTRPVQESVDKLATINYRLGLLYRSASEVSVNDTDGHLDRAIKYSRDSVAALATSKDLFQIASAKISLANCLSQKLRDSESYESFDEPIALFRETLEELERDGSLPELIANASSNFAGTLLQSLKKESVKSAEDTVNEALRACARAISISEEHFYPDLWGGTKINSAALFNLKAKFNSRKKPDSAYFFRIQAIAAYLAAVEVYPLVGFPQTYAEAHFGLANTLFDQALTMNSEMREMYLYRARGEYEAALQVFTEERNPLRWAQIQMYLGSIFGVHAEIEGISSAEADREEAIKHYLNAIRAFEVIQCPDGVSSCRRAITRVRKRASS